MDAGISLVESATIILFPCCYAVFLLICFYALGGVFRSCSVRKPQR